MKIERIIAKQAHPVPNHSYMPRTNIFAPEILQQSPIIHDYAPQPNGGAEEMPIGGTAQNNFRELEYFKCLVCDVVANERDITSHYNCVAPDVES